MGGTLGPRVRGWWAGASRARVALRRGRSSDALISIAVTAVVALLLLPGFRRVGLPMDEGQLITYPEWFRRGAVPHRDFELSYGPAILWTLDWFFRWLGPSVTSERVAGLVFRLLIVAAVYRLAWALSGLSRAPRARAWAAAASASTCCAMLVPSGLYAFAWFGALACLLWSLHFLIRVADEGERPDSVAAGALAALCVSFRVDLALAVALSALPLLAVVSRRNKLSYGVGMIAGLLPLGAHVARLGLSRAWWSAFVEPVLLAGPGRRLPFPPRNAVDGFFVLVAALSATALFVFVVRRPAGEPRSRARAWLALSALSLGTLPQLLQRADAGHAIDVACFTLPLVPLALGHGPPGRWRMQRLGLQCCAAILGLIAIAIGLAQAAGPVRWVSVAGRQFPLRPEVATDLQPVLHALGASASTGDRLFVGPRDLRRTNYGDTFIYFLLPGLAPASYYTEMNPGVANGEGSSLARDLLRADFLVLSRRFDDWHEPNRSSRFGSDAPARVIADHFCLRLASGSFELFQRCSAKQL